MMVEVMEWLMKVPYMHAIFAFVLMMWAVQHRVENRAFKKMVKSG